MDLFGFGNFFESMHNGSLHLFLQSPARVRFIVASPCAVFAIIMLSGVSSGCVSKGMNIRASWDKSNPVIHPWQLIAIRSARAARTPLHTVFCLLSGSYDVAMSIVLPDDAKEYYHLLITGNLPSMVSNIPCQNNESRQRAIPVRNGHFFSIYDTATLS